MTNFWVDSTILLFVTFLVCTVLVKCSLVALNVLSNHLFVSSICIIFIGCQLLFMSLFRMFMCSQIVAEIIYRLLVWGVLVKGLSMISFRLLFLVSRVSRCWEDVSSFPWRGKQKKFVSRSRKRYFHTFSCRHCGQFPSFLVPSGF